MLAEPGAPERPPVVLQPSAGYPSIVAHPRIDPLSGIDHMVVDGTNLLYALKRGSSTLPAAALVGRLRAMIRPETSIELVFDGAPEPGMRRERIAVGVSVRYAAPISADAAIVQRSWGLDQDAADHLLVVTDDRDLRSELERRGARTVRCHWLITRLERGTLAAPSVGNPKPPAAPSAGSGAGRRLAVDKDGDHDGAAASGPGWTPGRGATAKRGNGRRLPRAARQG